MKEIWKIIKSYPNYKVSNLGRVKSNKSGKWVELKQSKPSKHQRYCTVMLSMSSKQSRLYIHRLVLQAFVPNKENKPHTNHKNGKRNDNRLCNLEWATNKENQQHALRMGLHIIGEDHANAKLTNSKVIEIKKTFNSKDRSSWSFMRLAKKYKVAHSTIEKIYYGKTWGHISINGESKGE